MFYALTWSVVFLALALWSLTAWAFHSIVAWSVSNSGALLTGPATIEGMRATDWLAPWVPPELALSLTSMQSAFVPAIEAMLDQAPALAGGLSVATWVAWGIGSFLIVVLGLVFSGLLGMLRRRASAIAVPTLRPASVD